MIREGLLVILTWLILGGETLRRELKLPPLIRNPQEILEETANKNSPGVVKITGFRARGRTAVSEGTGFVVATDGTILTNKHVVSNPAITYRVTTGEGVIYEVGNIKRDPDNDIAVVKINPEEHRAGRLQAIDLGDSTQIKSGEPVAALGNDPGKIQPTLLTGRVLGVDDTIVAGRYYRREILNDVIRTNLNLVSGNSGSPLLDVEGRAVGINTATSRVGDTSFAIPINEAKDFLESVSP